MPMHAMSDSFGDDTARAAPIEPEHIFEYLRDLADQAAELARSAGSSALADAFDDARRLAGRLHEGGDMDTKPSTD